MVEAYNWKKFINKKENGRFVYNLSLEKVTAIIDNMKTQTEAPRFTIDISVVENTYLNTTNQEALTGYLSLESLNNPLALAVVDIEAIDTKKDLIIDATIATEGHEESPLSQLLIRITEDVATNPIKMQKDEILAKTAVEPEETRLEESQANNQDLNDVEAQMFPLQNIDETQE